MRSFVDVVRQAGDLHSAGMLDQAAFLYENLLGAVPDDPMVLYLYGTLASQQKRFGTAIIFLRKSVEIEPKALPQAWHNLGVALRNEGHTQDARRAYRKAIALDPDNPNLYAMLAGSYVNTGAPGKALEYADEALRLDPNNAHALNHRALALLEMGRYAEAWPAYERRFDLNQMNAQTRPFSCPRWEGEPVRKLAVHGEQGIGDEIMFLSCLPELMGRAEEVVIECEPRLKTLLERSFGVKCYGDYHSMSVANPDFNAFIPMGSLPSLCRSKDEDFPGTPFLKADPAKVSRWRATLAATGKGPFVGMCWHGGTKSTHQDVRNAPHEDWKRLIAEVDGTFVSAQYGEDAEMQAMNEFRIPHWNEAVDDLDEFAAFIAALDCVVTVCQSAAHFAGGLGVPCLVLTPRAAAWRYTGSMPWYGSVELFRQGKDWPFKEVKKRLADFTGLRGAEPDAA